MKIAVLGWGSLVWDPRDLLMQGRWRRNGPLLPVEFSRESSGDRLTLALTLGADPQRTYWTLSPLTTLADARKNLQARERAKRFEAMHWVTQTEAHDVSDTTASEIRAWLQGQTELEAVIWTGLSATLNGDVVAAAVQYLASLETATDAFTRAHEYVTKAPPQIQTRVRNEMQQRGWIDVVPSDDLFE